MKKFLNYIKTRKIGWWITTILLVFIILLIVFPSFRMRIYMAIGLGLPDPDIVLVDQPPKLSEDAYKFSYRTLEDEGHMLSEFKGEVVLLNFWATWCTPCIMEMESLEELHKKYGNKVKFILYSNELKTKIKSSVDKIDRELPFVYAWYDRPQEFEISVYPTTFIISRSGEIILHHQGAANWNTDEVHSLLDALIEE